MQYCLPLLGCPLAKVTVHAIVRRHQKLWNVVMLHADILIVLELVLGASREKKSLRLAEQTSDTTKMHDPRCERRVASGTHGCFRL